MASTVKSLAARRAANAARILARRGVRLNQQADQLSRLRCAMSAGIKGFRSVSAEGLPHFVRQLPM